MHSLTKLTIQSTGIRELPSSIGNMRGLTELYLESCEDLVSLPNNLCNLKNLQRLYLCGCKKLEKLPENIGDLQELWLLDASDTGISQAPPAITKLGKLWMFRFSNERQFQHSSSFVLYQVSGLSSLKYLYLCNLNLLGGLPEDLGSLQYLEHLDVRGSNISCLPKSVKELLWLKTLDVKFCLNLNELPGKLPPNLEELYADYHLALKSIRDLVNKCLKLRMLSISWFGHEKSECGTVSSEQVNVFLQHFLRTCIQCDFHQRDVFLISCPKVRIPDLFNYQFINLKEISIELNPSWYTGKFMGFLICCCSSEADVSLVATLLCKSDPVRKHSLMYVIRDYYSEFPSAMCFIYIPFKTLWHASDNKEGKKPNDYCLFEASIKYGKEACWGIRLEYENKVRRWRRKQRATKSPKLVPVPRKDAAVTTIGCSIILEQREQSRTSDHNIATDRGLHLGYENEDPEVDQAAMAGQKEYESQNVELTRVCDNPSRKMGEASRKRKRKRKRKRNKKGKAAGTNETSSRCTNTHMILIGSCVTERRKSRKHLSNLLFNTKKNNEGAITQTSKPSARSFAIW